MFLDNLENRKEPFDFLNEEQKENVILDILMISSFYVDEDAGAKILELNDRDKAIICSFVNNLTKLIDGKDMKDRLEEIKSKLKEETIKEFFNNME